MAFLGYVLYDGIEITNTERLAAYARNGIVPVGTKIEPCETCEGLGAALGQSSYESPLLDNPPWLDPLNIDTFDFGGILITEITGVDDATGRVDMTPTLTQGAVAGRRRYGPREMGVSAWVTGRTTEGVQAGLAWLKTVLRRTCTDDGVDCGPVAPMELLTVCPTPICPTPDETGVEVLAESYLAEQLVPYGAGSWTVLAPDEGLLSGAPPTLDGGTPDTTGIDGDVDGGTPDTTGTDGSADGGAPASVLAGQMMVGHAVETPDATVRFTVTNDTPGAIEVTFYLVDGSGTVLLTGPTWPLVSDPDPTVIEWALPDGLPAQPWSVVIGIDVEGPLTVSQMQVFAPTMLDNAACLAPYWRTFPQVATVSGPVITERQRHGDCAEWVKVEWIWTSGSPWRYGTEDPLMLGSSYVDPDGSFAALGVFGVTYDAATADSCSPPVPIPSCADDPCYPGFTLPPTLPVIPDPDAISVDGETTRGVEIRIDPDSLPNLDGIMSLVLDTDTPKLGVRIRVYDNPAADWSVPDTCDPAYGWLIDFIPANGTVIIDGTTGLATTICEEIEGTAGTTPATGLYGGPLPDPTLGCERRVKIVVEWVTTYLRSCAGVYVEGEDQGDMRVNVTSRTREN